MNLCWKLHRMCNYVHRCPLFLVQRSRCLHRMVFSCLAVSCLEDDIQAYGRGLAHRKKGFKNLYSLRGGVAKYLKEEGASEWNGRLFVFDSRLAVPPAFYHGDSEDRESNSSSSTIARCLTCGSAVEPVHRNCANLDCNNLYL